MPSPTLYQIVIILGHLLLTSEVSNVLIKVSNFDTFLVTLKRSNIKYDLIVLTECWLNENTIIPRIPGYDSFRSQKHVNKSGGVVAYVKESWDARVEEPLCNDCNCLKINMGYDFVAIAILYIAIVSFSKQYFKFHSIT
jgi:hypothetical protein